MNIQNKIVLISCALILFGFMPQGQCQDAEANFVLSRMEKQNSNPAFTGIFKEVGQIRVSKRSQHPTMPNFGDSYTSQLATFSVNAMISDDDFVGVGLSIVHDKAGILDYSNSQARLQGSFVKNIWKSGKKSSHLALGFSIAGVQRSIDWSNSQLSSQHDGFGNFDPNLPNGLEYYDRPSFSFLDLGCGALFYTVNQSKNSSFFVGGAWHHFNKPNVSFSSASQFFLSHRYSLNLGGEFLLGQGDALSLAPMILYERQSPFQQLTFTSDLKFKDKDSNIFRLGAGFRVVENTNRNIGIDAILLNLRTQIKSTTFGVGFDLTTSSLANANRGFGAIEAMVVQSFKSKSLRRNIKCPEH